jgi:hypothetical protein
LEATTAAYDIVDDCGTTAKGKEIVGQKQALSQPTFED